MSAEGNITLWLPEPNTVPHQAAGKLGEELGEAGAIAARILIQGFGGVDPKSGKPNRAALLEELADIESVVLDMQTVLTSRKPLQTTELVFARNITSYQRFSLPRYQIATKSLCTTLNNVDVMQTLDYALCKHQRCGVGDMNANAGSTKDAKPAPAWSQDSISAIVDAAPFKATIAALWKNAPDVRRMFRSVPILGCFTIMVADGEMRISHHAIDMDITAHIRAAGSGRVVIPATALRAFVAACDGDEVKLHKEVGGARVALSCGSARASVIPMAVADLPMCFENLPEPARTFELAEGVFRWLTALPAVCWSTENTRYYLNGICFEIGDKEVRAVATNGHSLGFRKVGVGHPLAAWDCRAIVPREAMGSVLGAIGGKEIRVELFSMKGERHKTEQTVMGKMPVGEKIPFEDPYRVRFTSPGWTISAKLIDGTFPDWRRVVPQPQGHTLLELSAGAMKRASALAGKAKGHGIGTHAVRVSHHEDGAIFAVKNPDIGDFTIAASGTSTAPFDDFGVNVHYLATLASAFANPAIRLEVIDPGSPIRIEPADNLTGEFAILMPMRV